MAWMAEAASRGLCIPAEKELLSGLFRMGEEDFPAAPEAEALACKGKLTNATISKIITTYRYSLFIIHEDPFFTDK
jgi:hypothetical protein